MSMIRYLYKTVPGAVKHQLDEGELDQILDAGTGCLWIDICYVPSQRGDIETFLKKHFKFHPLALDDALNESHLSRIDEWDDYAYLVIHGLDLEVNRTLDPHELDIFIGHNYLVTMHEEPIAGLDKVWGICGQGISQRMSHGADHLLYVLIDQMISDYMPVVDGLDEEVDEIEQEVYDAPGRDTVSRIFRLRRTLLRLRRLLGYLRETLNRLARDEFKVIAPEERIFFRDAYDHTVRLFEISEGLRDMANASMESFMSVTSNRINEVMRTLTVVNVLFMPLSFIVGFFGMNFFGATYEVTNPLPPLLLLASCLVGLITIPFAMLHWISRKGWLHSTLMEKEHREVEED